MADGSGERGGMKGRAAPGAAKVRAGGPPKFMNRIPLRDSGRPPSRASRTARADNTPHYIPLTRVRSFAMGVVAGGGRPFAPRVSIERGDLPGHTRLDVRGVFETLEARIARATSLALGLPTPKRSSRPFIIGSAYTGVAFALLYQSARPRSPRGEWMKTPAISSLDTVSLEEALAYLDAAEGDELGAAFALATDRNQLDGSSEAPDDAEVHHALFLLRRARGLDAPSFDLMRIQLKRRVAA